eukprot:m.6808 g.6808  ORF g.6808 m.6808 type:complete len:642 (+) comp2134_c0_seq1:16-1941(+)
MPLLARLARPLTALVRPSSACAPACARWGALHVRERHGGPPPDLRSFPPDLVRNFCIIAHVDHGKSTMADRLLEITGTIPVSTSNKQVLDSLPVEQERGVTVRAHTASMFYEYNGQTYLLNLIDTPGHVDFNYEVRCSLAACQGVLLVVDASQGVEAQTVANFYLAFERDMAIIPVMNKIDLPTAQIDATLAHINSLFDLPPESVLQVSAKKGIGMDAILPAVIERVPPPSGNPSGPLRALLFDSWFNEFRGVIMLMEIVDGTLRKGDKITSTHTKLSYEVLEVGLKQPNQVPTGQLCTGQVGYVIAGMRSTEEAYAGDTFFGRGVPVEPLPGFKAPKPMVFAGLYPIDQGDYEALSDAIAKLLLDDAGVTVRKDTSVALGAGWRLGFLGMLHMDVFRQRLEQEYDLPAIVTSPSVSYLVRLRSGEDLTVESPANFPDYTDLAECREPIIMATLIFPQEYLGKMIDLCQSRRGMQHDMTFLDQTRVMLKYTLPLSEIVEDFFDQVKSVSAGYASFDYEEIGHAAADLVKLQILINGQPVDALASVVHAERVERRGRVLCERLKDIIPRQLFEVALQASVKGKVIARETVKALRKDVTAKCYGGDISRKMKLLQRQKEGKKRMRMVGNVELPKEAFLTLMKR